MFGSFRNRGRSFSADALYHNRGDKGWPLTDCLSFVVMEESGCRAALTADIHFVQAGYRALLREPKGAGD